MKVAGIPITLSAVAFFSLSPTQLGCSSSDDATGDASRDASPDARRDGSDVADSARCKDCGVPFLTGLAVSGAPSGDGSVPVGIVPPFSPDVHDYYVRCAAGTNVLRVSMTASPGALSSLLRPTASGSAPRQTLTASVGENQAIVAAAANGMATTEYWVRCLPPDFPQLRMTSYDEAGAPPGYYLVGNFQPQNHAPFAIVLDGRGVPVWYRSRYAVSDVDAVVPRSVSFYSRSSGSFVFEVHQLSPLGTSNVVVVGLGGLGLDTPSPTVFDGHELRVLPNGHYLVLSNPFRTGVDLSGVQTISAPDGGHVSFGPSSTIQDCTVVEVDPKTGAVSWQWAASDHLEPLQDTIDWELAYVGPAPDGGPLFAVGPDGSPVVDPFHCNSIDVDPTNGNLLLSARYLDSIFYVERRTGAILWKLGGAAYTKDHAAYVEVPDPFHRQHDARLRPGWSADCNGGTGRISVFDDESYFPRPARAVVYDVVVGGGGGTSLCDGGMGKGGTGGRAIVAWQHHGATSSRGLGSFRISADDSRVIGWGYGAPNLVFTEVDIHGAKLLDFEFTDGNSSYRAVKVPIGALDLSAMRDTAGLP